MSGSISSSFRVYFFLPLLVQKHASIVLAAITAAWPLFARQLTVTPGRSQRHGGGGVKGENELKKPWV